MSRSCAIFIDHVFTSSSSRYLFAWNVRKSKELTYTCLTALCLHTHKLLAYGILCLDHSWSESLRFPAKDSPNLWNYDSLQIKHAFFADRYLYSATTTSCNRSYHAHSTRWASEFDWKTLLTCRTLLRILFLLWIHLNLITIKRLAEFKQVKASRVRSSTSLFASVLKLSFEHSSD